MGEEEKGEEEGGMMIEEAKDFLLETNKYLQNDFLKTVVPQKLEISVFSKRLKYDEEFPEKTEKSILEIFAPLKGKRDKNKSFVSSALLEEPDLTRIVKFTFKNLEKKLNPFLAKIKELKTKVPSLTLKGKFYYFFGPDEYGFYDDEHDLSSLPKETYPKYLDNFINKKRISGKIYAYIEFQSPNIMFYQNKEETINSLYVILSTSYEIMELL